jgi:signal transduction histidine kinase
VAGIVARHAPRAAEKRQTLAFAPGEGLRLPFHGDPARLAQAIDNLVDNAVKYTPVGGAVRVAVARRDPHLCISVSDAGPGLGAADVARMFQPFQRLSAEPTAGESSTGLGLHITREFVAQHGGTVEVDTAPGCGTTFTVLLPAPPVAAPV